MTPYLLPTATTEDERARLAMVAILPIGSFEQHGPYLPLITDTIVACSISQAIAEMYPVRNLPPITISCSHEHRAWPGTVSISAGTLAAVITDIQQSLQQSGISKLVLINGHGGNYVLRNVVQEATVEGPHMALYPASSDWARARSAAGMITNDHEDMHAGELETSLLLHACPELVRDGYHNADHTANERPGLLTTGMQGYTTSGIIGRPSLAAAPKGRAALTSLVGSFAACLQLLGEASARGGPAEGDSNTHSTRLAFCDPTTDPRHRLEPSCLAPLGP
jgi:creatinine amidohydrolase